MKILVPVDGSKYSMEALKIAADYAKTKGANICLINVVPFIEGIDLELSAHKRDDLLNDLKRIGEDAIGKAMDYLKSEGVMAKTILSTAVNVAEDIISVAEKEKFDLVIIGSRGLSPSSKFKMGSVAARVARHAPCSVYIVKLPD